jgi:hypothetical protein
LGKMEEASPAPPRAGYLDASREGGGPDPPSGGGGAYGNETGCEPR